MRQASSAREFSQKEVETQLHGVLVTDGAALW